jgi:DedD protein
MRFASAEVPMDSALKQRLLGAAVLIALAVIVLPMFLGSSPPKEASSIQNLDIPPLPERKFETRTLPVDGAAPAANPPAGTSDKVVTVDTRAPSTFEAPETKPAEAAAPPAPTAQPETSAPRAAQPVAEAKPAPPPAKPASDAGATAASGRFRVNLGVYVAAGHAEALVARLKKAGFAAYAEAVDYHGKPAQAVRVGPFSDRAAAEAARLRVKQKEPRLPSSVTESADQPTADAPATALAADRAGGWAVQLGAFKSEAEANKLRARVRAVGVAAFIDRTGAGDDVLWRVRAGPFAERSTAETTRNSLKAKLQADGMIVTQP